MRILITGSRDWTDRTAIGEAMIAVREEFPTDGQPSRIVVVHGNAEGADTIAAHWAEMWGWLIEPHDVPSHAPKGFGPRLRNQHMVNLGATVCLAFIGPCTDARCDRPKPHGTHGSTHCASLAEAAGIPTRRYETWRRTT